MNDLFADQSAKHQPLAAALRPKNLSEIFGQAHLLQEDSLLRRRIRSGTLGTIILYGPPGIGKTSIARAIGQETNKEFRALNATKAGVSDVRKIVEEAKRHPTLIFIDEIQRFSSTQADELLALSEEGIADLIGATTGNPYHVLPPALISRSVILQLQPLSIDEMTKVVERAIAYLAENGSAVSFTPEQIKLVVGRSGGDARRAITAIESLSVGHRPGEKTIITDDMIAEVYAAAPINHDRAGDAHYDVISAFIKSMRGSDPDATLYWLARLIHAGEDPRFIARRIMIHASEDVGLADNSALQTAVAALHAVEKIGYPEAQIVLAHAALHIARAPKSGSAYRGIGAALAYVKSQPPLPVPLHLRDTHYKGATKLGHVGYKFPHDYEAGWVEQEYAPNIPLASFYQSDARENPTFERRADEYWGHVTRKPTPKTKWSK